MKPFLFWWGGPVLVLHDAVVDLKVPLCVIVWTTDVYGEKRPVLSHAIVFAKISFIDFFDREVRDDMTIKVDYSWSE